MNKQDDPLFNRACCATCNRSIPGTAFASGTAIILEREGDDPLVWCSAACSRGQPLAEEQFVPLAVRCIQCFKELDMSRLAEYPEFCPGTYFCSSECQSLA